MPVVPAPMMPTAMAVMPVHLLGLQATDLVAGGDGRMRIIAGRRAGIVIERKRRERRRLDGCCKSRHTGGDTEGHLQKIPAFHQSFPLLLSWTNCTLRVFSPRPEHRLNHAFMFEGVRRRAAAFASA